ncbi:Rv0909 family putative TA system antitoxin [Klenkia soli]|uniref:Rv0909 family putative TA system antitoxin n=1 Tax=Klenkia soli TaxID=1052260 RepID=UPI0013F4DE8D|nr:Rv0909 family putative TA system antitoxin [Klenkia soli]
MDFGSLAKKAQDALAQGSDKIEAALKDNAGKIEGAVDKAGQFAKEKMPDRAAQIDNATAKAKAAVPRHEDGTGAAPAAPAGGATPTPTPVTPPAPVAEPGAVGAPGVTPATHTAPDAGAPSWTPPSPTPEVDRAAREQG